MALARGMLVGKILLTLYRNNIALSWWILWFPQCVQALCLFHTTQRMGQDTRCLLSLPVTYLFPELPVHMEGSLQSRRINLFQEAFPILLQMKGCAGTGKLPYDGSEPKQEGAWLHSSNLHLVVLCTVCISFPQTALSLFISHLPFCLSCHGNCDNFHPAHCLPRLCPFSHSQAISLR